MREIKFRGKTPDYVLNGGEWLIGDLMTMHNPSNSQYWHAIIPIDLDLESSDLTVSDLLVRHETIGQFTGLHDKNGKDIFEGDIIKSFDSENHAIFHIIEYNVESARFTATLLPIVKQALTTMGLDQSWLSEFDKEVVGNIHDKEGKEILKQYGEV